MATILLCGGTGFVGARLQTLLREQGHHVRLLTRTPQGPDQFAWDTRAGTIDDQAVQGVDAVINLAGAGIADGRWTAARRREIVESRVQSAALLRQAFQRTGQLPAVYLSASAIGYYGNSGELLMHETDEPTDRGFLATTCLAWEQAADEVAALGIRTVKFRIGVVLGQEGGALREIIKPLRLGLGSYFGDGRAWYSWIHRDDLCRMFIWALENKPVAGVFNAVAPHPARNRHLVEAAAQGLRKKVLYAPVPAFALRLALGEMADTILFSTRVSAEKIQAAGFEFGFTKVDNAMAEIFRPE